MIIYLTLFALLCSLASSSPVPKSSEKVDQETDQLMDALSAEILREQLLQPRSTYSDITDNDTLSSLRVLAASILPTIFEAIPGENSDNTPYGVLLQGPPFRSSVLRIFNPNPTPKNVTEYKTTTPPPSTTTTTTTNYDPKERSNKPTVNVTANIPTTSTYTATASKNETLLVSLNATQGLVSLEVTEASNTTSV